MAPPSYQVKREARPFNGSSRMALRATTSVSAALSESMRCASACTSIIGRAVAGLKPKSTTSSAFTVSSTSIRCCIAKHGVTIVISYRGRRAEYGVRICFTCLRGFRRIANGILQTRRCSLTVHQAVDDHDNHHDT